jgi:exo-rhamnogalacturonan lyase-like protein
VVIRLTPLAPVRQSRRAEPVTVGVPLPIGLCHDPARLVLEDTGGIRQPLQSAALDRWSDGSLRWVLLDAQLHAPAHEPVEWRLGIAQTASDAPVASRLELSSTDRGLSIQTGSATFEVRAGGRFPFDRTVVQSGTPYESQAAALRALTGHGSTTATVEDVFAELAGPLRSVIVARGRFEGRGATTALRFSARLHFVAGSATVRLAVTVHNPRGARHERNQWALGDSGSVFLRALELALPLRCRVGELWCSVDAGSPLGPCAVPFELYQDSSGGEAWDSPVHRNRDGVVPVRFRGFAATAAGHERRGLRASPTVVARADTGALALAVPGFWQNCPRSLTVSGNAIVIGLFPAQSGDVHELQGGEQKTHEVVVAFAGDTVSDPPLAWCHEPLRLGCDPAWYAQAEALPGLTPADSDPHPAYLSLVRLALDGPDPFLRKRERIDEYGWRHFGDLYADHETVFHAGPQALVSHYNNQYDAIAGFATQFFRDRDERWWTLMDDLARHVVDIDVYRTTEDKAAYNNGLFWHTDHYQDAGTATHRAYPRGGRSAGGPSAEHNYTTGLMLHYFLTGNGQSRATAIVLAEWVIAMDEGATTVFRVLSQAPTGLASSTWSPDFHGPGRGAGNSVLTCLNAVRLTGERRFLDKADQLIRRCIHPLDDPAAHDLLDAERRWSYTVFLQALGRYLDDKHERGEHDLMYGYARESLRRYARWMVAMERPYLECPDRLEFPNETWAAQDIRKSEVFDIAALHATGDERREFLDRAAFFFDYSVRTLGAASTASLTRPVVLMLSNGWRHAWFARERQRLPEPVAVSNDFPPAERFRPQKRVALARARVVAVIAAILLVAVLAALAVGS